MNGELRRLLNEELYSLCRSPNVVWVIKYRGLRWVDHIARMEEGRNALKILIGKPTGNRRLGRSRCSGISFLARFYSKELILEIMPLDDVDLLGFFILFFYRFNSKLFISFILLYFMLIMGVRY